MSISLIENPFLETTGLLSEKIMRTLTVLLLDIVIALIGTWVISKKI